MGEDYLIIYPPPNFFFYLKDKEFKREIYKSDEDPEDATTLVLNAQILQVNGDYQKALELYEGVLRKNSSIYYNYFFF